MAGAATSNVDGLAIQGAGELVGFCRRLPMMSSEWKFLRAANRFI